MELNYGDWTDVAGGDLSYIEGILSNPSKKVTFPFDVGLEHKHEETSPSKLLFDGCNDGGDDNQTLMSGPPMPNNLPPPILPQPSPGASLGISPPPPSGVAAVDNQMMQQHSPQHQLAQHQPMPGFRMPDHHTPPAGIRQQTHSSHMMMGRPEPHHHMIRPTSQLNVAAPEFVPGGKFIPSMVTPGMPHPTPLQGQPHLMRQPDQLHHHQGAVSQQAQLSPAAAQQLTSEALIHQQMFAGAPVYATHSPTMMHNRTQMRPGLPADHAQFMPHAAMIPAVTEMQQPYPGIQQQNSHLVSKPRGGSGHVMPSSYMPQSGLQHPPAPTGVDVPINMMSGHQMNGPNHDHQQQPMGHNMSHGPPPRHRNHRAMQNGHNNAPPPRYTLLKRTEDQRQIQPDMPQSADIIPPMPSELPAPGFDTEPMAPSEAIVTVEQIEIQSKSSTATLNTSSVANQDEGSMSLPVVDRTSPVAGGSGFTFPTEGPSFGFFIDGFEFGKNNNEAVQLPSSHTKSRNRVSKAAESSTKPLPSSQSQNITSPVHSKTASSPAVETTPIITKPASPRDEVITNGVNSTPTSSAPSDVASPPTQQSTTPLSSPPQPQASAAPKSWANLFANTPLAAGPGESFSDATPTSSRPAEMPTLPVRPANDAGAIISRFTLKSTAVSLQARRLINQVNWCYVNATLQALLACPPFYHALKALPSYPPLSHNQKSSTPVLDAMVEFVNEFSEMRYEKLHTDKPGKQRKKDLKLGEPFEPSGVYNVLPVMKTSENMFARGKQEDAEEFLTCLLNKLHEEMAEAVKQHKKKLTEEGVANGNGELHASDSEEHDSTHESEDDDGAAWEEVGRKNKSVVTHSNADNIVTPISEIFGGLLRSSLSTGSSSKESTVIEPFFTVPLNVQTNKTVEEALRAFVSKEIIEGYTCQQTKQETDAHRRLTFERLPPVLILHLKCFVYDDKHGGSQKVMHTMDFSTTLEFEKELFSPQAKNKYFNRDKRSYKLFAVEYHSGNKTTGGHYHTDLFHLGVRHWVRFDDNSVSQIEEKHVLDVKHPCVPYLLYYKRMDTLSSSNAASGANNSNTKTGAHNSVLIK